MYNLDKLDTQAIKKVISTAENIIIVPHKNPDGDAIGACLGMHHLLKNQGINSQILAPNEFPKFLKWMPEAKKIFISAYNPKGAEIRFKKADLIFLLDFNEVSRTDNLEDHIHQSSATKIMIDHHQFPEAFDYVYSDTKMPATCEMIYHFAKKMNWEQWIDKEVATCLFTGILTDTGNFRFPSVQTSTFLTAAALKEHGAEPYKIQDQLYDVFTESRYKLLSRFLDNMHIFPEYRTTLFTLTREELQENGFQKGDTDGFVNYGLSMKNMVFSVFMAEDSKHDFVKISFRSKGNFDASEVARKHFSGGGHINAAGGRSDDSLGEAVEKFKAVLPEFMEQLTQTEN